MRNLLLLGITICCFLKGLTQASQNAPSLDATLPDCIAYALKHQPLIQQSLIDEKIVEADIKTRLADWLPQLNLAANYTHYLQLPTNYFGGNFITTGSHNTSFVDLGATQNIFDRDVLLALRSKSDVKKAAAQITDSTTIDIVAAVSKAFYDILLTEKQVAVLDEDIVRLARSLQDAYNQYKGGIVDKTDYKRATISLNNAKVQRKQQQDLLTAKYFYLRQLMGYPDSSHLALQYDSLQLENEIFLDTLQEINYNNRIEYQLLQTEESLQEYNLKYYKWGFLPTVSAFGNYNINYFSNNFTKLYEQSFINSNIGVQLAFPIFQGGKRTFEIRAAQLQVRRLDWAKTALQSAIRTQYAQALASYKGNLVNYTALKENVQLANDVYTVIRLQYQQGIKTYLDVIIAESDLRSAQLDYYQALYQLLQSKIDVQKALGTLTWQRD